MEKVYEKLERTKVFRDPLYGYVNVDYKIISDLIDSKEFQRLRRIRQLSGVSMVFQTAEHSRFTHSLGAYEMANIALQKVRGMEKLNEYDKIVFLCAALLHDVGHGPYSHAFEGVLGISHEEMTIKIILSPITEINKILNIKEGLADDIASVIRHDGKHPLLESFVSSQLDVDRFDYLSRDAYFTGTAYGKIDYMRILRSMLVKNNTLYVKSTGVQAIEAYLVSRYHMYFQVYYHPVARSYESILESIYRRIVDLTKDKDIKDNIISAFLNTLKNNSDIASYIELDDAYVNGFIKQFTKSKDKILNKLANCFINRHLFACVELDEGTDLEKINEIKNKFSEVEQRYFFIRSEASAAIYLQSKKSDINDIKVLLPDNKTVKSIDQYSDLVKALRKLGEKKVTRIYYLDF